MSSFPGRPAPATIRQLRKSLGSWYRAEARDLPWRRTQDPYAIWLSEAMLQQTRVATVIDYWTRFLQRFPTVGELAAAPEEEVLALWSGLGYYRRARSLHAAAQAIVAEHSGTFPKSREAALSLPGVGPYTAGAVLSIAYDQPEPLVDGNVERVFSRVFGLSAPSTSPALTRECWELARLFVPKRGGAGDWNQALMELGATLCMAKKPDCERCPWSRTCRARASGEPESLPLPRPRKEVRAVELEMLVMRRSAPASQGGTEILLERRPATGRMPKMWQLPTVELLAVHPTANPTASLTEGPTKSSNGTGNALFPLDHSPAIQALLDPSAPLTTIGSIRHGITHHRIQAHVRSTQPRTTTGDLAAENLRWVVKEQMEELPLTGLTLKAIVLLAKQD